MNGPIGDGNIFGGMLKYGLDYTLVRSVDGPIGDGGPIGDIVRRALQDAPFFFNLQRA